MYPWPNRHSAPRGRWEGAEVGVEMVLALSKPRDIIFHEHQPLDSWTEGEDLSNMGGQS